MLAKKDKQVQSAVKKRRKIEDSLNWLDLAEVREDGLILRRGKTTQIVKGIKLAPHDLFLETRANQADKVSRYRMALNQIDFTVYEHMVYNPIDVETYRNRLIAQLARTPIDHPHYKLIEENLNKLELYCYRFRELEFFLMIKGKDDKQFHKRFSKLVYQMTYAGFKVTELKKRDYDNYLANVLENDKINDYYFARGEFEVLANQYKLTEKVQEEQFLYETDEVQAILDDQLNPVFEFSGQLNHLNLNLIGLVPDKQYFYCSYPKDLANHKRLLFRFTVNQNLQIILLDEKGEEMNAG